MAEDTPEIGPIVGIEDEVIKTPDVRKQALFAFNSSYDFLQGTPDSELPNDLIAAKKQTGNIKERTVDKGRDFYTVTVTDAAGGKFRQRVYPPVDHLQAFLVSR